LQVCGIKIFYIHEGGFENMLTNTIQKWYAKMLVSLNNQKGAQAIEWIALAGVILAIFAAIQLYFNKGETSVGNAISETLSNIIKKIGE
jgi:Flp pilus assembly pilin Flp